MNGYKRIIHEASQELERCRERMRAATRENDAAELMRWTRHSMAMEDVIIYATQKIEAQG